MKKLKERSDWFKGLLYAEQMYKDGYDFCKLYDNNLWVKFHYQGIEHMTKSSTMDFVKGVHDYAEHILKVAK
jgi:hypothetical protein